MNETLISHSEMVDFINQHYAVPVQKHWQPGDYENKYYTKARIEKTYIKENARYLQEFEKQLDVRNKVLDQIRDMSTMPPDITNLFYMTIQYAVNDGIQARENFRRYHDELLGYYPPVPTPAESYRKDASPVEYMSSIMKCVKNQWVEAERKYKDVIDPRNLDYYAHTCQTLKLINLDEFFERGRKYMELKKWSDDSLGPQDAIIITSNKCADILEMIRKEFNGNPDTCVRSVNWGVGGIFNGVLEGNCKKVSFKSFIAGGWNIQRRHIRFRITELKR